MIPCKDCITFPMCKARAKRILRITDLKCSLLDDYVFKDNSDMTHRADEFMVFFGIWRYKEWTYHVKTV